MASGIQPLDAFHKGLPKSPKGIEIGAHTIPTLGIDPLYVDKVFDFAATSGFLDLLADAMVLPFPDGELDYICSSHVLEHLPDPLYALHEWHRVLRKGGQLYLVIPDKRFTFDQPRRVTPPVHMLTDFWLRRKNADASHISDFIFGIDWEKMSIPSNGEDLTTQKKQHFNGYMDRLKRGEFIDIHYHTFTPSSILHLLKIGGLYSNFNIVSMAERYPPERGDGIAIVLERKNEIIRPKIVESICLYAHPRQPGCKFRIVSPCDLSVLQRLEENQGGSVYTSRLGRMYFQQRGIFDFSTKSNEVILREWSTTFRRTYLWLRGLVITLMSVEELPPNVRAAHLQVYLRKDGTYSEDHALRLSYPAFRWTTIRLTLPEGTCESPLRVDPTDETGLILVDSISLIRDGVEIWHCEGSDAFRCLAIHGDVDRSMLGRSLALSAKTIDPQILIDCPVTDTSVVLKLRLCFTPSPGKVHAEP